MKRRQQPKRTLRYSDEFKTTAVEMSQQEGVKVKQVAEGLDIHPFMLSRWRKEYREGKFGPSPRRRLVKKRTEDAVVSNATELEQLRREVKRLRKENDLLKKWQRYLAEQRQNDLDTSRSLPKS